MFSFHFTGSHLPVDSMEESTLGRCNILKPNIYPTTLRRE